MWVIFRKEVNEFWGSLVGYIAISIFLLANGLFCWVFRDTSILENGYAVLDPLFQFAPWIFMFLIPAITMKSFAEEKQSGTLEFLVTKPITDTQIILGKFFAALFLVIFSILPTLLYYFTIYQLSSPVGNVDTGGIAGSYIGLAFLGAAFVAIGIFTSSLTKNQIIAFILGLVACFFFYIAFDSLGQLPALIGRVDHILSALSINQHYSAMSKGVIDSRDVVYFLSVITVFLISTKTVLESRKW